MKPINCPLCGESTAHIHWHLGHSHGWRAQRIMELVEECAGRALEVLEDEDVWLCVVRNSRFSDTVMRIETTRLLEQVRS
jgi:hypothetical protein